MEDTNGLPPYLSYQTLKGFLLSLANNGVPSRIERGQVSNMNGKNQTLTLAAMRFLGLISQKGRSLEPLNQLTTAEGKDRERIWRAILKKAYPKCFEIDLQRTTTEELCEIFQNLGVSSKDTARKCVTFFSYAVKDAGIKFSPHVQAYKGARSGSGRPRKSADPAPPIRRIKGNQLSRENESTDLGMLLEKVPKVDPKWPLEEINKWLHVVQRIKKIATDDPSPNERFPNDKIDEVTDDKQGTLPFDPEL